MCTQFRSILKKNKYLFTTLHLESNCEYADFDYSKPVADGLNINKERIHEDSELQWNEDCKQTYLI